ncbi:GPI inositol deacylase [Coemansia sp. RSA 720]|nr:GPI inositol deacylase [Coemansia sp. RSA 720]KAJ2543813.1 GPI inositol deacylase [Coemansia sp. RSA 1853]
MRSRIGTLCLLLVTVVVGLATAHSYFHGQPDTPNCAMSYSRPRYIEQTEFGRSWTRYSAKYKLYLYREGGFDVHNQPFRIPVLFVPGNAGSHKQVRSIAAASSSAFVKLVGKSPELVDEGCVGYDFFTVGLNEELTALHGYSILEQADFVNDAIRYILSLYPKTRSKNRLSSGPGTFALPTSVVVVGHSMGGVVARTAFTLPNHIVGSIQAIFTLSTPHNNPTASLERHVEDVYSRINQFWRHGFRNGTLDDVSLVSIAGGNLDSMINSDYAYVGDLAPPRNALSVLSSGINDVWLSLDHQSILWCAQMASKFSAMMVRIMDARQPTQLVPLDQRMAIMRQQLYPSIDNSVSEPVPSRPMHSDNYRYVRLADNDVVKLHPVDMRALADNSQTRPRKVRALHLLALHKEGSYKDQVVQILYDPQLFAEQPFDASLTNVQLALLGCNRTSTHDVADADVDVSCTTLSIPKVTKLPLKPEGDDPKMPVHSLHYVEYPAADFEQYEYVGIEIPTNAGVQGFMQASLIDQPQAVEKSAGNMQLLVQPATIVVPDSGKELGVRSRIKLVVPEDPFIVYRAQLTMRRNPAANALSPAARFGPVVRQSDGRRYESKFWYDKRSLDLAMHGRGAYLPSDSAVELGDETGGTWDGLYIDVWADAGYYAGLELTLHINWYSSLNRMVKRYDMALLAMSFVWASLVLLHQLRAWNSGNRFPGPLQAIERLVRNGTLAVLVVAAGATPVVQGLVAHVMRNTWSAATLVWWSNLFLGVRGGSMATVAVPALLVVVALGFVLCQAMVLTAVCALASWIGAHVTTVDAKTASVPGRALAATIAFVVFVSTFVPYQFAFLVIYLAQLITVVRTQIVARTQGTVDLAQYQFGLLLFWTSSLPYCAPELLVWVRNLSVLWFDDAPADHNLVSMVGYFALRMLASYNTIPRLQGSGVRTTRLRTVTYVCFAGAIASAWVLCMRRPYILYSVNNAVSAWLALVQFADSPLRLIQSADGVLRSTQSAGGVLRSTQSADVPLQPIRSTGRNRESAGTSPDLGRNANSDEAVSRKQR